MPLPTQKRRAERKRWLHLVGNRVIVPPPGRPAVMEELHDGHPGICRMKGLARSHVWRPGMDTDLEAKVKNCAMCPSHQKALAQAPLHPWEWPKRPWARVHADYAGPFMGKMFLILVDAHSKWLDIHIVNSATSSPTIEKMRSTFATTAPHCWVQVWSPTKTKAITAPKMNSIQKQTEFRDCSW